MEIAVTGTDGRPAAAAEGNRLKGLAHPLPQFLYYAAIFTIPFFRWRQFGPVKVDWLLVMALALIVIPYLIANKTIPSTFRSNLWPWFGLFVSINLLSSILSPYPEASRYGLRILLLDFIFISINLIMVGRAGFRTVLPAVLIVSVTTNAFLAMLGYFLHVEYFLVGTRGVGGTMGANNAAVMGVFVMPFCLHWMFEAKHRANRLAAGLAMAINILGIVSTESRGGFLVMCVVLLIMGYQSSHRFHPRYLGLVLAGGAMFLLAVVLFTPDTYLERIESIGQGSQADVSTQRRSTYIVVGLESFVKHPLIGTGTLSFRQLWLDSDDSRWFDEEERAAHNTYLEVLVGSGLIGLAFFAMLLIQAMSNYNHAIAIQTKLGMLSQASLANAYRVAYVSVLVYFIFKTGLDHKMFLLALPLSQTALDLAKSAASESAATAPARG